MPLAALLLAVTAGADWPLFRGDTALSGRSATKLPAALAPVWTFRAAGGFESSAAVAAGIVYAASMDGVLHARAAGTGKEIFTYAAGAAIKSSPSVFDGRVYFGDESGVLHAVDARSGKGIWRFSTGAAIASSAIRAGDRIVFGSNDNDLYGLDLEGRKVWSVETGGYVYATSSVLEWEGAQAVVSSGCDGFVRVVRARDGALLRKIELGAYVGASPALDGHRTYLGTFENQVLAVDLRAGKILWTYENPDRKFPFISSAAISPEAVFIGGRDKTVVALDPKSGAPRWVHSTKGRVDASAVLAGDRLYTATTSGEVLALDPASGRLLWQFEAGSSIVGSPAVGSDRLFVGTADGTFYAFGAP